MVRHWVHNLAARIHSPFTGAVGLDLLLSRSSLRSVGFVSVLGTPVSEGDIVEIMTFGQSDTTSVHVSCGSSFP